jgi:hypothetical protein
VCLAFFEHAQKTYPAPPFAAGKRPEGELGNFWDALRPLRRLYGQTPAAEFGPVKLAAVRDSISESLTSSSPPIGVIVKCTRGSSRSTAVCEVERSDHEWLGEVTAV